MKILIEFWERIQNVRYLTFIAKAAACSNTGWSGEGKGDVNVIKEKLNCIVFKEHGKWKNSLGEEFNFNNIFRWTLKEDLICLEHLRFGRNHPVFLFDLIPNLSKPDCLYSIQPHLCREDSYYGKIFFYEKGFHLKWRIKGPDKNEEIIYSYFFKQND